MEDIKILIKRQDHVFPQSHVVVMVHVIQVDTKANHVLTIMEEVKKLLQIEPSVHV